MAEEFRVGPARVLVAAAITDPPEDWTDLGLTRGDVFYRLLEGAVALGRADQSGRTPRADGVYLVGRRAMARCPMTDSEIAKLVEVFPGAVHVTDSGKEALGCGSGFAGLSGKAFAVVPEDEYTEGSPWWDSEMTHWLPLGVATVMGEWPFGLPEGEDALAGIAMEVQIASLGADQTLSAGLRDVGGIGEVHRFLSSGNVGVLGLDFLWEAEDGLTPKVGSAGTFARASAATYVDENGVIQTAASGELRNSHYEAGVQTCLLEGQRTNYLLRSEQFNQSPWVSSASASVTPDDAVAPDGNATADLIQDTNAAGPASQNQTVTVPNDSSTWCGSVYVEKTTSAAPGVAVRLELLGGSSTREGRIIINPLTGVYALAGLAARGGVWSAGDYWRVWVTLANNSTGNTSLKQSIYPAWDLTGEIDAGGDSSATGSRHFWGGQLENNGFPSSYIKTEGTAVTRVADSLYFPLPSLIQTPQELVGYAHFVEKGTILSGSGARVFHVGSATHDEDSRAFMDATGGFYRLVHDNGTTTPAATLAAAPSIEDSVELRGGLLSDGSVLVGQSINSATETTASDATTATLSSAWAGTQIHVNGVAGNNVGFNAFRQGILARRIRSLTELRAV